MSLFYLLYYRTWQTVIIHNAWYNKVYSCEIFIFVKCNTVKFKLIMKTKSFFFLAVLGLTLHLNAQEATRLYDSTRTFVEDGYTYQCDVPASAMVTLYNKENKLTYVEQIYKDTGKHYSFDESTYVPLMTDEETDTWTRPLCFDIVNAAFTKEEAARTK